ncbi:hypothetical protein CEXT_714401 [Caerostris extrusa]|uniref:Uncharacterized protein n=1 Tax=Caerostris extrusa TaxID=172846 RepID=A0AAV4U162_CAEEX|nr:hypothetical protein CEXT_714401 [Caerostris extrusa]
MNVSLNALSHIRDSFSGKTGIFREQWHRIVGRHLRLVPVNVCSECHLLFHWISMGVLTMELQTALGIFNFETFKLRWFVKVPHERWWRALTAFKLLFIPAGGVEWSWRSIVSVR